MLYALFDSLFVVYHIIHLALDVRLPVWKGSRFVYRITTIALSARTPNSWCPRMYSFKYGETGRTPNGRHQLSVMYLSPVGA